MATDARISVGLPTHPKTKKLVKRLGQAAAWNLVCLILWAASNRSDGDLAGMSDEDIELAADWSGEEGAFVRALLEVRFLDGGDGAYMLHDWQEHNPWAAGADMRSAKARWNAAKRHHGAAEADRLVPEYAAVRSAASNATSTQPAEPQDDGSNAPSPSPSPSPKKLMSADPPADLCPHVEIISAYHELLPELTRVRTWEPDRQALLRARWREAPERQNLTWWREFFEYVRRCPFLLGQEISGHRDPFLADLEWLIRPRNFRKVIEGKYESRKSA